MNFEPELVMKLDGDEEKDDKQPVEKDKTKSPAPKEKKVFSRFRRREYPVMVILFCELMYK